MTVPEIIDRCTMLGIHLQAEGERLLVDAPKGVLTDELLALLRENKEEILANRSRRVLVFLRITQAIAQIEKKHPSRIDWNKDSVMVRTTNAALDEAMSNFINGHCDLEAVQDAWKNYIKALEGQFDLTTSILEPRQTCFL